MTHAGSDPVTEIIRGLGDHGFVVERVGTSDDYSVHAIGDDVLAHRPVLSLPPALLAEYLEQMSRNIEVSTMDRDFPDPGEEALHITTVHLAEDLGFSHPVERHLTRSAGLVRRRDGRLSLVVDLDLHGLPNLPPDAELEWVAYPPTPDSGPGSSTLDEGEPPPNRGN